VIKFQISIFFHDSGAAATASPFGQPGPAFGQHPALAGASPFGQPAAPGGGGSLGQPMPAIGGASGGAFGAASGGGTVFGSNSTSGGGVFGASNPAFDSKQERLLAHLLARVPQQLEALEVHSVEVQLLVVGLTLGGFGSAPAFNQALGFGQTAAAAAAAAASSSFSNVSG